MPLAMPCLCRLIQALRSWLLSFKPRPKAGVSRLFETTVCESERARLDRLMFVFYCHCFISVWPNQPCSWVFLSILFFSGLLSSDYVEIHYEGGKPVLSKVTSSISLDETFGWNLLWNVESEHVDKTIDTFVLNVEYVNIQQIDKETADGDSICMFI